MRETTLWKRFAWVGCALLVCLSVGAQPKDPQPLAMLKNVTTDMVKTLTRNQSRLHSDKRFLPNLIRKKLVPHFTVTTMARSVVGRDAWKKATASQRSQFKKEFTEMVIDIYAAPLTDFDRDVVKYHPLRASVALQSRVKVDSVIVRKTGQKIPLQYRLVKIGTDWKVYDFSIEGVSMVQSYRSQFSQVLRQKGFAGLLRKIHQHNRKV